jgi:hypothetical protein
MPVFRAAMVAALAVVVCAGCGEKNASPTTPTPTPAPSSAEVSAALQTLASRAVYFGHQSVGYNIMSGVEALAAAASTAPRVQETADPALIGRGVFAHAGNGSNGDPMGKTAAFRASISGGIGGKADIAFFKYCYVDFDASTNIAVVFADYQSTMAALRSSYPGVRFVHVTVPLMTASNGGNGPREQFSELLRQAYAGKEPLFDLAEVESTRPDGTSELSNGIRALVPSYSSDGGHLNTSGAEVVAKALVVYLASL